MSNKKKIKIKILKEQQERPTANARPINPRHDPRRSAGAGGKARYVPDYDEAKTVYEPVPHGSLQKPETPAEKRAIKTRKDNFLSDDSFVPDAFAGGQYAYLSDEQKKQARKLYGQMISNDQKRLQGAQKDELPNAFTMKDVGEVHKLLLAANQALNADNSRTYQAAVRGLTKRFLDAGMDHRTLGTGEFQDMNHMITAFIKMPTLFRAYADDLVDELEKYGHILRRKKKA